MPGVGLGLNKAGKGSGKFPVPRKETFFSSTPKPVNGFSARRELRNGFPLPLFFPVLLFISVLLGSGFFDVSSARLLTIGGDLSYSYQGTKSFTKTNGSTRNSYVNSSSPQVTVFVGGQIPTVFFNAYRLQYSFSKQSNGFCEEPDGGFAGKLLLKCKSVNQRDEFKTQTYRISTNHHQILPFKWTGPMSLNAQRVVRETITTSTNKDTVESYGGNWILLNALWLPRVTLTYQESELQPENGFDILTRAASVSSDSSFGNLRVGAAYQFSQTETKGTLNDKTEAHSLNLDAQKQFSKALNGSAFLRVAKFNAPDDTDNTPSPIAPGITVFPQRGYGGALSYRPHLGMWDGRLSVAYSENPFFKDFKSLALTGNANFRFSEKVRSGAALGFSRLDVSTSEVISVSGSGNVQYRPIFGLTTGVSAGAGLTDSSQVGSEDTESLFQNYIYSLSYIKVLRRFQFNTGYNLSYGLTDTRPTGFSSRNLSNTLQAGLDNTNTRYVHVGLTGSFNNIQNNTESIKSDQTSYIVRASADSSYFRNLLFRGDSLTLRVSDRFKNTTGFGISGRVNVIEAGGNYQVPVGLSFSTAYRYEDYPEEFLLDRQVLTGGLSYTTRFFRRVGFNLIVRDTFEDNRYQEDINRFEAAGQLRYTLGKIRMFVRYLRIETRTSGNRFGSNSIYGQISRSF